VKITCLTPQGRRITENRAALLTPALRDRARVEANEWIKRLRLVRYGSETMRQRFTFRGQSLWWFTELFLHKRRKLEVALETILALDAARAAGASAFEVDTDDETGRLAVHAFGASRRMRVDAGAERRGHREHEWPSRLIGWTAGLSSVRRPAETRAHAPRVAAFIHTAFWRAAAPQDETYIGPVLDALASQTSSDEIAFVGLGPRRNFRARRWWDPVTPGSPFGPSVTAIERFAGTHATRASWQVWKERHRLASELIAGEPIRAAAIVRDCDLWPVLEHELKGAALVQWPWSARTMDEAGAAIDALDPRAIVTYAEAGGWGRALMLEARRRGVPSVGLQHGFIYRHWLNYLHEPDEMQDDGVDRGFPRPDRTLVYDGYAAEHLTMRGHFPPAAVIVTGSSRLEDLATRLRDRRSRRDEIRQRYGVTPVQRVALLVSKFSEIHEELAAVLHAVSEVEALRLLIKPHPAETAEVYRNAAGHHPQATIAATAELADLLAAADVLVTRNSTVAVDGLVLGLPAVVVGLPNNLSPFVEDGVMLGADGSERIRKALEAVLYDRKVQEALSDRARAFVDRYRLAPEPGAAARAAHEILTLATSSVELRPSS
jgi:hypothetical protein